MGEGLVGFLFGGAARLGRFASLDWGIGNRGARMAEFFLLFPGDSTGEGLLGFPSGGRCAPRKARFARRGDR